MASEKTTAERAGVQAAGLVPARPRTCQGCGSSFRGRKRLYCSPRCGWHARRRKRGLDKVCRGCGGGFLAWRPGQAYCSLGCSNRHKGAARAKPLRECKRCGRAFRPKAPGRVTFCSRECAFAYGRARKERRLAGELASRAAPLPPARCKICGTAFTPTRAYQKLCGDRCRAVVSHLAYLRRQGHPATVERGCPVCEAAFNIARLPRISRFCSGRCHRRWLKAKGQEAKRRRRARLLGCYVEPYDAEDIFERDGWVCHLCGEAADRTKAAPHPRAPTIDHVIPVSKRGADAPFNVRCAHFLCNSKKGDALGPF